MSDLRKLAHLQEQIGDERFATLIDSGNTGKVKEFCDALVKGVTPTEMTIGSHTYEILDFLREGETSVTRHTMVERAKEMNAHLGGDDGQNFLDNQKDVPASVRDLMFVFTDWRRPDYSEDVYCVYWCGGRWVQNWYWLDNLWYDYFRVLRRK